MPTYHVLLIGIDDYPRQPLHGCVDDVDAVQRLLLGDRVGLSAGRLCRLVSPRPGSHHPGDMAERPATLANIRHQLARLASEAVTADDRVVIFFAGHGCRLAVRAAGAPPQFREALVPVDAWAADEPRLLFADELAAALAAIRARTPHVAFVLDACCSPGAARARELPGQHARCIAPPPGHEHAAGEAPAGLVRSLGDCLVVAASLEHEAAYEVRAARGGHGLFTAPGCARSSATPAISTARRGTTCGRRCAPSSPSSAPVSTRGCPATPGAACSPGRRSTARPGCP